MITFPGNLLDLFDAKKFDAIVHGCNCYHLMGAGIAGQIAERYPEAYEADKATLVGPVKLGTYSKALIVRNGVTLGHIINMYTQDQPGRSSQAVLSASIRQGFRTLNFKRQELTGRRPVVGVPLIGAGIAGGDWDLHAELINEVARDLDIVVVTYKPGV